MREIKFRAWHKEKGWTDKVVVYGDGSWSATYENIEGYSEGDGTVLMQYTGLKDKHGREVYEGDIVKGGFRKYRSNGDTFIEGYVAQVVYDEDMQILPFHEIWDYDYNLWMQCLADGFEIIGNMYEHPELLQGLSS